MLVSAVSAAPQSPVQPTLLAGAAQPGLVAAAPRGGNPGRILVAQNSAEALVRIQEMEEQLRVLNGQVEGLQFQLTQMQTLLERMTEDNEFRFQALEGGAVGKPRAAAPTDGVTPSAVLPQDPAPSQSPQSENQEAAETLPGDIGPLDAGEPMHDIDPGLSQDPLLGGGRGELGRLEPDDALLLDGGRPLDLSLGGGEGLSNGDANAQYAAGYEAIERGDYGFAEEQFRQFVQFYPDDPQAPDAVNWLGEALIQRQAYTDAAEVLAEGYTTYRDSRRAPDIMLKLGVALAGAEQPEVACRTFFTLDRQYPDLSAAFRQRLVEENQKAQCPPLD